MGQFKIGDRVRVPRTAHGFNVETGTVIEIPNLALEQDNEHLAMVRLYVVELDNGLVRRFTGAELERWHQTSE